MYDDTYPLLSGLPGFTEPDLIEDRVIQSACFFVYQPNPLFPGNPVILLGQTGNWQQYAIARFEIAELHTLQSQITAILSANDPNIDGA